MSGYDIVAGIIIAIFLFEGLASGFLRQVIRLLAVIAAGYTSVVFGPQAISQLHQYVGTGSKIIIPLGVFILTYVLVVLIGGILIGLIKKVTPGVGFLDKLLGALLGFIKGAVLIYVVTGIIAWAANGQPVTGLGLKGSRIYAWVKEHPVGMQDLSQYNKKLKSVKKEVEKRIKHIKKDSHTNEDKVHHK